MERDEDAADFKAIFLFIMDLEPARKRAEDATKNARENRTVRSREHNARPAFFMIRATHHQTRQHCAALEFEATLLKGSKQHDVFFHSLEVAYMRRIKTTFVSNT